MKAIIITSCIIGFCINSAIKDYDIVGFICGIILVLSILYNYKTNES